MAEGGPEHAPLVVLLSPLPESILSFQGSWLALTAHLRVVAIDLPGFGGSQGDGGDMSPAAQGSLLAAILEDLGLDDVHLVGLDVGMGAGLAYALDHEHRLASLVVGHGPGAPGPVKLGLMIQLLTRSSLMRWVTALLGTGPMIAYTSTLGAIRQRYNPRQVDDFKAAYAGRGSEVVQWFANFHRGGERIAARLHEVDVPTLVCWGELDALFDVRNGHALHQALPRSELLVLPDAGHLSWADQPELFARAIVGWVQDGSRSL